MGPRVVSKRCMAASSQSCVHFPLRWVLVVVLVMRVWLVAGCVSLSVRQLQDLASAWARWLDRAPSRRCSQARRRACPHPPASTQPVRTNRVTACRHWRTPPPPHVSMVNTTCPSVYSLAPTAWLSHNVACMSANLLHPRHSSVLARTARFRLSLANGTHTAQRLPARHDPEAMPARTVLPTWQPVCFRLA